MVKRLTDKLAGKRIALCVTGSVAAIVSPRLARELRRHGAEVTAYMSSGGSEIIHQNAMEFATGKSVVTRLTGMLEHLWKWDLVIVAPATANTIAKIACGMGDTPITALILSSKKVLLAPAMNQEMYENPLVAENIKKIKGLGHVFVDPMIEEGEAKMAPIEEIVDTAIALLHRKGLKGLRFLVSAGATQERIDPVRVITNNSSGKMGLALAREAYYRGADVTMVLGRGSVSPPRYLRIIRAETGDEMLAAVKREIPSMDVFISAAAVSDFRVEESRVKLDSRREHKITLLPAPKILHEVRDAMCLKVGFKALYGVPSEELLKSAHELMEAHRLDMVVANDLSKGIMGSDDAEVYIITRDGAEDVPRCSKAEVAAKILDSVEKLAGRNAG
jgi:phosphopantothenoylcysteine decarboxylase/phosphopantothenate--cysteine ligase